MLKLHRYLLSSLGALVLLATLVTVGYATNGNPINKGSQAKYTLAVVGDMPYGAAKIAAFPGFIDFMNGDPKVDLVAHLGDIKSGSTLCTDEYFEDVREQLDRLKDPVVYTPGDNEWTDCHRASNGNYKPTERLDQLRSEFFPIAGPDNRRPPQERTHRGQRPRPLGLRRERHVDGVESRLRHPQRPGQQQ